MSGKLDFTIDERRGSVPGKFSEVINKVSLVVITAVDRSLDPVGTRNVHSPKHSLKTLHSAKALRGDADGCGEASLKLSKTYPGLMCDIGDQSRTGTSFEDANGKSNLRIRLMSV
jgi:hypothetical protein